MGAGLMLSSLGLDIGPVVAYAEGLSKIDKVKSAKQTYSLCYYCSVTCGLICSTEEYVRNYTNASFIIRACSIIQI